MKRRTSEYRIYNSRRLSCFNENDDLISCSFFHHNMIWVHKKTLCYYYTLYLAVILKLRKCLALLDITLTISRIFHYTKI